MHNNGARFVYVLMVCVLLYSGVRMPHVCVRVFTHCVLHYNIITECAYCVCVLVRVYSATFSIHLGTAS